MKKRKSGMVGGHWRCTQMRQRLPFGKVTPQMMGQSTSRRGIVHRESKHGRQRHQRTGCAGNDNPMWKRANLCLASAGTSIRREGRRAIPGTLKNVRTVDIELTFQGNTDRKRSG